MGNVMAASSGFTAPPMSSPSAGAGISIPAPTAPGSKPSEEPQDAPQMPEEHKPGLFEDAHKKARDVFPNIWDGARLLINKQLSSHFQVSHNITMGQVSEGGYRFGATYIGPNQISPAESYPVLVSDIDPQGNLNAQILHAFNKKTRCKAIFQFNNGRVNSQFTGDYRGDDFSAALTAANVDIVKQTGIFVGHYLQRVTERLDAGAELVYQYDKSRMQAIYSLAGRYTADKWVVSANYTFQALGVHLCYYHKVSDNLQMAASIEGSVRQEECTGTVGYTYDLPNYTFKGQLDTNYTIGATVEKKLAPPLPFAFCVSALANHQKSAFRFGLGLNIGQ